MDRLTETQSKVVADFVAHGVALGTFSAMEETYRRNQVLALLHANEMTDPIEGDTDTPLVTLTDQLVGMAPETDWEANILRAKLLNVLTPTPDALQASFDSKAQKNVDQAVTDYYELSKAVENVKVRDIARNIAFNYESKYGTLEITINLSKPEKTTAEIKAAAEAPKAGYPESQLDYTNEGYAGTAAFAPRSTHRVIRIQLGSETWGWHFSPYAYYNEHAIFVNFTRQKMRIDRDTFAKLLTIVSQYPMYMVGSNADLPIVGGSILGQEHFQGGRHEFPMMRAASHTSFTLSDFPDVEAESLKWPMSVLRLKSKDMDRLIAASEHVRQVWEGYTDTALSIHAQSEQGERQHTVTPIARVVEGMYEMYLVLRDNGTSDKYPAGIFHPHADVQHIKQENIGLIEVMGLAILPGRLVTEMDPVKAYLLGKGELEDIAEKHQTWAERLKTQTETPIVDVDQLINDAIGAAFEQVLADAGVFKDDEAGQVGLARFIGQL
jgi:UDPglucose--hexose-1-phosphate uridylyltransferase